MVHFVSKQTFKVKAYEILQADVGSIRRHTKWMTDYSQINSCDVQQHRETEQQPEIINTGWSCQGWEMIFFVYFCFYFGGFSCLIHFCFSFIDWCRTLWRIFLIFIRVQAEWQVNSGCFLSVQYFCILRNVLSPFLDASRGEFSLLSDGNILLYLNLLIIKDNYWDEFFKALSFLSCQHQIRATWESEKWSVLHSLDFFFPWGKNNKQIWAVNKKVLMNYDFPKGWIEIELQIL